MPDDRIPESPAAQSADERNHWLPSDQYDDAKSGTLQWDPLADKVSSLANGGAGVATALQLAARDDAYGKRPARMSYLEHAVDTLASVVLDESNVVRQGAVAIVPEAARLASFMVPGSRGVAGTVGLSMLAQMSPNDSVTVQVADGLFGAIRGGAERGAVAIMGAASVEAPLFRGMAQNEMPLLTGIAGGVVFRGVETMTSRSTYLDQSGNFNLRDGVQGAMERFVDPRLVIADTVTAGVALRFGGMMPGSPLLRQTLGAGLMGAYSGANSELIQQAKDGHGLDFDYGKIALRSVLEAGKYSAIGALQHKAGVDHMKDRWKHLRAY